MMTSAVHSPSNHQEKNLFNIISWTTLLVGILDLSAAFVKFYIDSDGKGPIPVLRYIASAVFGKQAATASLMIIWGIVFHFIISFLFTLFFFLIYPQAMKWIKNKFITGIIYGVFAWIVMNLVVVPLSLAARIPFTFDNIIITILILVCMMGTPVAIIAHKYYAGKVNGQ